MCVLAAPLVTRTFTLCKCSGEVKLIDFVAAIKIAWPKNNCWDHKKIFSPAFSPCTLQNGEQRWKAPEVYETKTSSHSLAGTMDRFARKTPPRKTGLRWRNPVNKF